MKVLSSPASPFGRKVKITAKLKGLYDRITFETVSATDVGDTNPLSKIPALITDDGMAIYDSPVICEYLDAQVASPVLFPGEGAKRWRALTLGALGDGIIDAAIMLVYESRHRPAEMRVESWCQMQQKKIDQALDHLEATPPEMGSQPHYGHVTLAVALAYLDFRHEGKWRAGHPKMVAWLNAFDAAVPAFKETAPPPA
ncbi:MAG: glutathione S-transferase [Alphaproteobacteria bacterium]|jgi:glutathione S-transferase